MASTPGTSVCPIFYLLLVSHLTEAKMVYDAKITLLTSAKVTALAA